MNKLLKVINMFSKVIKMLEMKKETEKRCLGQASVAVMKFMLWLAVAAAAALIPVRAMAATPLGGKASITPGEYILVPTCASSRALTIQGGSTKSGANAYIYKNSKMARQVFVISSAGNGQYRIRNKNSGKYLEVKGGSFKNKANIRQNAKMTRPRQRWYFIENGNYYIIQACYTNTRVMTVAKSANANKANVYTYSYYGSDGQLWKLVPYGKSSSSKSSSLKGLSGYKTSTRKWNDKRDYALLTNIIGAVESGGQVYGNRNYAAYAGPYTNSSLEKTITLGWAQFYGNEAQKLIKSIKKKAPKTFAKLDSKGLIKKALTKNWVSTGWKPSTAEKKVLIKLITSSIGKACQDAQFKEQMKSMVDSAKERFNNNAWAILMYCEIAHLGGNGPADRIYARVGRKYTLPMIMASLKKDQSDKSSSNQVGDSKYWSRHVKCAQFIQKYGA